jgi:hypothetical protein
MQVTALRILWSGAGSNCRPSAFQGEPLAEDSVADAHPHRCSIVSTTSAGWQLSRRTGEDQGAAIGAGRISVCRAISVPSTPVTSGLSRSLADTPPCRSGRTTARIAQIPKLIIGVDLAT